MLQGTKTSGAILGLTVTPVGKIPLHHSNLKKVASPFEIKKRPL